MIGLRILCLAIGYAFGCIFQGSFIVGKIHKIDIRDYGSHNAGTTNAMRTLGTKAGLSVFLLDAVKAFVAVLLVGILFAKSHPDAVYLLKSYAFAGVVLGHNYPVHMGFRGGKGVACEGGFAFGFHPSFIPMALFLFFVPYLLTYYVSLGSLMMYGGLYVLAIIEGCLGVFHMPVRYLIEMYIILGIFTFMAYYRHRANIGRLLRSEERQTHVFKKNKEQLDLNKTKTGNGTGHTAEANKK